MNLRGIFHARTREPRLWPLRWPGLASQQIIDGGGRVTRRVVRRFRPGLLRFREAPWPGFRPYPFRLRASSPIHRGFRRLQRVWHHRTRLSLAICSPRPPAPSPPWGRFTKIPGKPRKRPLENLRQHDMHKHIEGAHKATGGAHSPTANGTPLCHPESAQRLPEVHVRVQNRLHQ